MSDDKLNLPALSRALKLSTSEGSINRSVYLSKAMWEGLEEMADYYGVSPNKLVGMALLDFLGRNSLK